ncbi:MAG: hypothetical protein WC211_11600 [Dehalococcoidia bacterium]
MRLARRQSRRSPRGATLPSSLRHAALLIAVVGTVAVGSQLARPAHANAVARPANSAAALIDGRQPDGAPAVATEGFTRTLFAVTVETPTASTAAAVLTATPLAASTPTPALAAGTPAQREVVVAPLSRITASPAPEPTVRAAVIAAPPASRYATIGEMNVALAQTPWPAELWPRVVALAMCEAGIDSDRDGRYDTVDTQASGAGGRYIGALQIGAGHTFSRAYDLHRLVDNLAAGHELWVSAGGSFAPWGCR